MKKKIIIGLTVFSLFFLIGGIYIISKIESATSTLDNLITLHQVEILREHLLLQIKRVQSDINLKNTRYARNTDTVIKNVLNMEQVADTCFQCHHTPAMQARLRDMREDIQSYKKAVSRVFTIRANSERLEHEEDETFKIGEQLIDKVNTMISMASSRLETKTQTSLKEIARTKSILYFLVALGPVSTLILAVVFIKGFNKPVNSLLNATKKLKEGDLDYRIEGLKDEFGVVASSFNDMSYSLKKYMHKIEESEKRYRMLFESAGDAIFILEAEGENIGKIVSANRAAALMHGYTVNELLELNIIKDLDTPESTDVAAGRIQRILDGEWINMEITHRRKDGTVFPVEVSAGLLEFMDHKYILAFDRDITERKHFEETLKKRERQLSDSQKAARLGSWEWNIPENKLSWSDELYRLFGLTPGEFNATYEAFLELIHPDDREYVDNAVRLAIEKKEPYHIEARVQNRNGTEWVMDARGHVQYNDEGSPAFMLGIAQDITERKKAEEALQRSQQMKIVGEWAAGLAHEIKNSLAGIKVSVEVLAEEADFSREDRFTIVRALDEIKRIESLLKSLLNFAKPPKPELYYTNVNETLEHAIGFLTMQPSSSGTDKIHVRREYDDTLPDILADQLQLRQVFMNILLNARETMQDGGEIHIKTSYDTEDASVNITISDTGKGIDEKIIHNIFQPFITNKSKGTGLGLAISKQFVEQLGGTISASNRTEGGAVFSITLPVRQKVRGKIA